MIALKQRTLKQRTLKPALENNISRVYCVACAFALNIRPPHPPSSVRAAVFTFL